MVDIIRKNIFLVFLLFVSIFFFQKTLVSGLLPIPADTIVGLYYPFRDIYAADYPRGVPFKNFLITDPVRQTYPWKNLVIQAEKKIELPLWNPYNFAGTPLLANFQSGAFYPTNLLFFVLPFSTAWTISIMLEPLLAGLFMYLFLSNLKLRREAAFLGAFSFSMSGFFIAWLEWGNIIHAALWLPFILLSIDKLISAHKTSTPKNIWIIAYILASSFSLFAGHLQIFVYIYILSLMYFGYRWIGEKSNAKTIFSFVLTNIFFLVITAIQWIPTLRFILLSARGVDINGYKQAGWFLPWQNLVQFVSPDFLGNPTTLNYFGTWNYGEFVGYIGVFPLIMALAALLVKRGKDIIFFGIVLLLSLALALPNPISYLPFVLHIPLFDTSQPTRLIFIADFCLAVLAAFGFDYFLKGKNKVIFIAGLLGIGFIALWIFILGHGFGLEVIEDVAVSKQNLLLPTAIFAITMLCLAVYEFSSKHIRFKNLSRVLLTIIVIVTVFDLMRFGWKFETFTKKEYIFPTSKILSYIQENAGNFRVMETNSEILPPNFSIMYKIQTLDGYDPLYLKRYGEFAASYARQRPDISAPFGFNRIITFQNPDSKLIDLMGVKYVISKDELNNKKLKKVFSDGIVSVYQNKAVIPRAFFAQSLFISLNKKEQIDALFDTSYILTNRAVIESDDDKALTNRSFKIGTVHIANYQSNSVTIKTSNEGEGFLVLTDAYYPTWHAKIDGVDTKIFITDFAFRGIVVPAGNHTIQFTDQLF